MKQKGTTQIKNGNVKTTAVKNSVLYCACRLFTKKVHYKCFMKEGIKEAKKGYLLCITVNSRNLSIFWGTFEIFGCIGKWRKGCILPYLETKSKREKELDLTSSFKFWIDPLLKRLRLSLHCTENSKQVFPENETARPRSQFLHSCICERFIYIHTIRQPFLLYCVCGPIVGIYKSLTDVDIGN